MQRSSRNGYATDEPALDITLLVDFISIVNLVVFDSVGTVMVLMRFLFWRVLNGLSFFCRFFFQVLAFFSDIRGYNGCVLDGFADLLTEKWFEVDFCSENGSC